MYEYLKVMKKAYANASTKEKRTLLMLNYRASLFTLYKSLLPFKYSSYCSSK